MRRIVTLLVLWVLGWTAVATTFGQQAAKPAAGKAQPAGDADARAKALPDNQPAAEKAKGADRKAPAAPLDPAAQARLDQLLTAWEKRSAAIQTLDAYFYRQERDENLGDDRYFEGRAQLKSPNLAVLDTKDLDLPKAEAKKLFAKAVRARIAAKGTLPPEDDPISADRKKFFDRIVCTGEAIYHYDGAVRQVFKYPLAKDQQTAMMQQGPLPFLFNMSKNRVLQRYDMRLDEKQEDDSKYVILVEPKLQIDRNAFKTALIYLNKKTFLPDLLMLVELNGNKQIYYLTQVEPNKDVADTNFRYTPVKGWPLVENAPLGEQQGDGPVLPNREAVRPQVKGMKR